MLQQIATLSNTVQAAIEDVESHTNKRIQSLVRRLSSHMDGVPKLKQDIKSMHSQPSTQVNATYRESERAITNLQGVFKTYQTAINANKN